MKSMFTKLGRRSNILYKKTSSEDVLIYEDHRAILTILFAHNIHGDTKEPIDLVMFDKHDDFLEPHKEAITKITRFLKNPTQEKLNNIIEFDLRGSDDDWVKAGMELGLIGNCFLFNSTEGSAQFCQPYKTKKIWH